MKVLWIKIVLLQVVSCTTDNASNFAKSFREYGHTSAPDAVPSQQYDPVVLNLDSEDETTDDDDDADVLDEPVQLVDAFNLLTNPSEGEEEYSLPTQHRCTAHTLNLLATSDVENVPSWSLGKNSVFAKVIERDFFFLNTNNWTAITIYQVNFHK